MDIAIDISPRGMEPAGDRRGKERHVVRLLARAHTADGEGLTGSLRNLSSEGFLIETDAGARDQAGPGLESGEEFLLDLPGVDQARARVVWAQGRFCGCEFIDPLPGSMVGRARLRSEPEHRPGEARTEPPVGERIAARRKELGWSRAELARRAGFTRPTIWGWESGHHEPREDSLRRLFRILDMVEPGQDDRPDGGRADADVAALAADLADLARARLGDTPSKGAVLKAAELFVEGVLEPGEEGLVARCVLGLR